MPTIIVDAILFDMDGTLVDSVQGVIGAWETFAETYPGIDIPAIMSVSHGVRTIENLRKYCGVEDQDKLNREAARFEQAIVDSSRMNGRKGILMLPGVLPIMNELLPGRSLPKPCWAICTSATRAYATAALEIAGVPIPDIFVTAEDVRQGKPEPDPYLLGAEKCNVDPSRCLVIEDAPSGVISGQRAACKTLALVTTHTREQMQACHPTFLVENLTSVTMRRTEWGVEVTIDDCSC